MPPLQCSNNQSTKRRDRNSKYLLTYLLTYILTYKQHSIETEKHQYGNITLIHLCPATNVMIGSGIWQRPFNLATLQLLLIYWPRRDGRLSEPRTSGRNLAFNLSGLSRSL